MGKNPKKSQIYEIEGDGWVGLQICDFSQIFPFFTASLAVNLQVIEWMSLGGFEFEKYMSGCDHSFMFFSTVCFHVAELMSPAGKMVSRENGPSFTRQAT